MVSVSKFCWIRQRLIRFPVLGNSVSRTTYDAVFIRCSSWIILVFCGNQIIILRWDNLSVYLHLGNMLSTINEVGTTHSYDYMDAILAETAWYTALSPTTSASFSNTFFVHFPALKEMPWNSLVIRGGAISDLLMGHTSADLDLFMFGLHTLEACVDKAR